MHRLLSWIHKRDTYLLLMLLDLGTAVVLAKLIVRVTKLIVGVLF